MNRDTTVIYVALMDEGTECWRPVQAEHVEGDRFRIVEAMPDGESWEFHSGAMVRCRNYTFSDGEGLLAIERADGIRGMEVVETAMNPEKQANKWPWPASMDALVAAAQNHTLLMENDRVRVMQVVIAPGLTVPLHTQRWPCVAFIQSWSDIVRRDADGNVTLDSRTGGAPPALNAPIWFAAQPPHTVENAGSAEVRLVMIEIKD